ncbi:hypothetical protein INR49_007920 [Caranx melampygus]|nr:hypothetical protein INR49_007920 [Caranx melampygus]
MPSLTNCKEVRGLEGAESVETREAESDTGKIMTGAVKDPSSPHLVPGTCARLRTGVSVNPPWTTLKSRSAQRP